MRWLIFAVVLALLPIIANVLGALTRGQSIGFVSLLENGELFLVSAAVVGAAIAELFGVGKSKLGTVKFIVGAFGGLVVLAASIWFADIAAAQRDGSTIDGEAIAVGSSVLFGLAVVAGLSCIVVGELAKD